MDFVLLDSAQKRQYKSALLEILTQNDTAFVPPLSQRTGTTQTAFCGQANPSGVADYLNQMLTQQILAVLMEGKPVGFVSYIENKTDDDFPLPNLYISTLVLQPETRGMGITKKLYHHLFNELYPDRHIYTRTWSTNMAHIKILQGFGFEELKRIPNHRGQGIDTVYYCKKHTS